MLCGEPKYSADKEREAGDYSKWFTQGQIYRIKARGSLKKGLKAANIEG